jgi:hypothetical protein
MLLVTLFAGIVLLPNPGRHLRRDELPRWAAAPRGGHPHGAGRATPGQVLDHGPAGADLRILSLAGAILGLLLAERTPEKLGLRSGNA